MKNDQSKYVGLLEVAILSSICICVCAPICFSLTDMIYPRKFMLAQLDLLAYIHLNCIFKM